MGFFKLERFGLGRFQYDLSDFGEEFYDDNGVFIKDSEFCLGMHIPSHLGPLTYDVRMDSYKKAFEMFKDRFGGKYIIICCNSWLLYPDNLNILPENSNAADFILGNEAVYEKNHFGGLLGSVSKQGIGTLAALLITVVICIGGVRKTVEKSVKYMMGGLFVLLIVLVVQACVQPGAGKGLTFFLAPKFNDFSGSGFFRTLHAAMAQAFFTLSIGIGSIAVCGSYMDKNRSLFQEGLWIILLDTLVAIASGLIIFPSCMAYGVNPDAGPQLIFITLPQVFRNMSYPQVWGSLFFIFLAIAALSTLVAVFENLVAFGMDEFHWNRRKSSLIFGIILGILTLPCILGFNLWQNFQPLGEGSTILDLEDFIVSANLLPLGAVYLVFFCLNRSGWGKENCFAELNTGKGWKLTPRITGYIKFVIPAAVLLLWLVGISDIFK